MKNSQLKYTVYLTVGTLFLLMVLYFLPDMEVCGHRLRRVDLLSDVRMTEVEETDTLQSLLSPVIPVFVDTCRTGLTCIEDYSDSTSRGMTPFYQALDEAVVTSRPVRIAYFGDSFIEADIFTADLRAMLQKKYGGKGVGFVNITSQVYGFRPTVRHSFLGWNSHSAVDSVGFDHSKQGMSGHYFIPSPGAFVELKGQKQYASLLDTCSRASILFYTKGVVKLTAKVNQKNIVTETFAPSEGLQQMQVFGDIGSVRWTVEQVDSALFYGVVMEEQSGIVLDNFSMRGTSGLFLRSISTRILCDFNRLRPYDLIVLHYGLNVATERGRNYDKYVAGMKQVIQHIKEAFPQAGILLVSVGDRDYKNEHGEIRTMLGIKNLVRYQQRLAVDTGVAFWNFFEAMGGESSMATLVDASPAMANLDYTHINFRGGKHLANLLYEALVYGKEQYDRRHKYESAP
ncbi:periplasmic protein [gut metagenome]|uniref:Periplasmic protein n=1 Tax=gut metagenome TaxID=749906 RepID=J9GAS8_9ZZZZ